MATTTEGAATPEARNYSVWHIDPSHSLAEFSVRHMMVTNVRGRFTGISGTIVDAGEDPIYSSVKSAIDVTTRSPAIRSATSTCAHLTSSM